MLRLDQEAIEGIRREDQEKIKSDMKLNEWELNGNGGIMGGRKKIKT